MMITSKRIEPAAKCIKRVHALCTIKYQQLQAQKFGSNIDNFMRDVAIALDSSLIVCLISLIVLGVLPSVFGSAKAEKWKDVAVSGNDTTFYNQGLLLFKLGNYTGPIENFDKALAIDPHHIRALDKAWLLLTSETMLVLYNVL